MLFNQKSTSVMLPISEAPAYFPNAVEIAAVGCYQSSYFEAVAIIVQSDSKTIYLRDSQQPILCSPAQ